MSQACIARRRRERRWSIFGHHWWLLVLAWVIGPAWAGDAAWRAADASALRQLRAVHIGGHWALNPSGVKVWRDAALIEGPTIDANSVSATARRNRFIDAQGRAAASDALQVRLQGVRLGNGRQLPSAGFWIVRDLATGDVYVQFRPSLSPELAGVEGFTKDVSLYLSSDQSSAYWDEAKSATGAAAEWMAAVLSHGVDLLMRTPFTLEAGAELDAADSQAVLQALHELIRVHSRRTIDWLRSMNVQWVGLSVALFVDSVTDPVVRLHRAPTQPPDGIWTFDDEDLRRFIAYMRAAGFHVYLTLAFEVTSGNASASPTGPDCGKPGFVPPRWLFGGHSLNANEAVQRCINPALWWWHPAHPEHATKVAAFFASYQDAAVHFARLAQEAGVEIFSLGTETDRLFRSRADPAWPVHFGVQLRSMVAAVRGVFAGVLTYDQHYDVLVHPGFYGQGAQQLFEDLGLDAVGISAYFPLVDNVPGGLLNSAELDAGWARVFERMLVPLAARNPGRPLLFTEVGYTDDLRSPRDPAAGEWGPIGARDAAGVSDGMRQQALAVESFFRINDRHGGLVRGAFWWDNGTVGFPNDPRCALVSFGAYCKPLSATIATAYDRWRARDVDRVFDWAESRFPQHFAPHAATQSGAGYLYRHYPGSGNYLGTRDGRAIVHNGRDWNFLDVGTLEDFLLEAARAGF